MNIADHAIVAAQSPALLADGGVISFGELYERSQRVAAALHAAGLRRGDGVALILPNRPEFLEITWACQLSGLYYTAVNTHFTPDEVAYVIDDSDARAVVVDATMPELAAHVRAANAAVTVHLAVGTPGGLERVRGCGGDRRWRAADVGRVGDAVLVGHHGAAQGRPPAPPDRRQRLMGSRGLGARADPQVRDGPGQRVPLPAPLYHAAGVNYTMAVNRVGRRPSSCAGSTPRPCCG